MKKQFGVGSMIVLMGLAIAGTALGGEYHTSMGVVGPKYHSKTLVVYRVDLSTVPTHLFVITDKTEIWGEDGKPIAFDKLQEGDYIREEYLRRPDGSFEAVKITVLTAETRFDR